MASICELCGTKKVPIEENTFVCPTCGQGVNETPRICDYCHKHIASMPSVDGAWICDYCIMESIVGPEVFKNVLAMKTRLMQETGQDVSLGDAFTAWRQLFDSTKISPTSPAKEVKTNAS